MKTIPLREVRHASRVVHRALRKTYGPPGRFPLEDPIESLVATILSQNTSDVNSGHAFDSLRKAFPTWERVVRADPHAVARAIRSGGLADIKSASIQGALRTIKEREGRISLERLRRLPTAAAMDYLLSLKGVGIKTTCCVLLFALGRPVMPVDTHVFRIIRRLGWIGKRVPIHKAHAEIEAIVPPRVVLPLHLYLIQHGRAVCRPQRPACGACCIARWCPARQQLATH